MTWLSCGGKYSGSNPSQVQLFFLAYFALTGLHAVHLTIGILMVAVMTLISQDGESNWMEGVQLLAVYVILGIAFFFLPV